MKHPLLDKIILGVFVGVCMAIILFFFLSWLGMVIQKELVDECPTTREYVNGTVVYSEKDRKDNKILYRGQGIESGEIVDLRRR